MRFAQNDGWLRLTLSMVVYNTCYSVQHGVPTSWAIFFTPDQRVTEQNGLAYVRGDRKTNRTALQCLLIGNIPHSL